MVGASGAAGLRCGNSVASTRKRPSFAGLHLASGELAVIDRMARGHLHRGLEAQDLLGRRWNQRGVSGSSPKYPGAISSA